MAREVDIQGLSAGRINIGPGATLAVYMQQQAGEAASIIKYFSGGSCEILGAPPPAVGQTWTGASLVNLAGTGYLLGTSESLALEGACRYYLMATGATATVMQLRGLSPGF